MTQLAALALALLAASIGIAAWRRGRRVPPVCMTCGRVTCAGCSYRGTPPGAGAL